MESRISAISNSGWSSTRTGSSGGWIHPSRVFGVAGSSIKMWNTGWTACRLSGSHKVTERSLGCVMTLYRLRLSMGTYPQYP